MKKMLILVTLIVTSVCAYATDWQFYGPIYVDHHSIKRENASVQAWIIHPDFAKSKLNNTKYTYEAAYIDAKCSVNEMAILNTQWYNNRHELVDNKIDPAEYVKVKSKTNNEVIFKALCEQLPKTL